MRRSKHALLRLALLAPAVAVVATFAQPGVAGASTSHEHGVFVATDNPSKNQIVAYHRESDGTLGRSHTYDTGGKGVHLGGATTDPLASQGSLTYDAAHHVLFAVNAGSDTVSVFVVDGDALQLHQVIAAGDVPVSVAVHGTLVYVLDAGGKGAVRGFHLDGITLKPIVNSARELGLAAPPSPDMAFLFSPGQVLFSPDGVHLIVTTKANGSHIDVFGVQSTGLLTSSARVNASKTPVPFALLFDPNGRLLVGEAGASNLTVYALHTNGTIAPIASATDNQKALCWLVSARGFFYAANTGSSTISAFSLNHGVPSLLGVVATTSGGTIDLAGR